MSTTAPSPRFRDAGTAYPLRLKPDRKIYRVGTPYPPRHESETLPMAACAFLTAHYRLVYGKVQRFDAGWLAAFLRDSKIPWPACLEALAAGVPFEGPTPGGSDPFPALHYVEVTTAKETASVLAEAGPVLAWVPWTGAYDLTSRAYGTEWVGPDGTDLRGSYPKGRRGALLKGVAWKFNAVRLDDGINGDRWFPFAELERSFGNGLLAVGAAF